MANVIESIALDKLAGHPGSTNRMSKVNFGKLVRNIERTGLYEPLIVRACPRKAGYFEIINGHNRRDALARLGRQEADCIVWDVDDDQGDLLLATLNRLQGRDVLKKKTDLLMRLSSRFGVEGAAALVPQSTKQLEKLRSLLDCGGMGLGGNDGQGLAKEAKLAVEAVTFVLDRDQHDILEEALSVVEQPQGRENRAKRRAAALAEIAGWFVCNQKWMADSSR